MISDILYLMVEELNWQCMDFVYRFWEAQSVAFNSGQYSIFSMYLETGISNWVEYGTDSWPYTDSSEYEMELYSSYHDIDVLDRAFSDVIWGPMEQIDEFCYRAQELFERAEYLSAFGL